MTKWGIKNSGQQFTHNVTEVFEQPLHYPLTYARCTFEIGVLN